MFLLVLRECAGTAHNDSVIKLLGEESFPAPPDGIVSAEIDPTTELLATDQCLARRSEYFIEGTQPQESCEAHTGEHPELPSIPASTPPQSPPNR